MTDTRVEGVQLTPQERQNHQAWEHYYQQRGQPIPRRTVLQNVLAGIIAPGMQLSAETSAAGRENLQSGGMGEFLTERPDLPLDRDLSSVEHDTWRINREQVLKATAENPYNAPPGKEVKFDKWHEQQWATYGWAETDKRRAKQELMRAFSLDDITAERAIETLLLAGYSADDVIARVADQQAEINRLREGNRIGIWRVFQHIFSSDGQHVIQESSAKVAFGQDAFDEQKQTYGDPQNMEDLAWRLAWTGASGGKTGEWMQDKENPMFEARIKTKEERDRDIREKGDYSWGKYYVNENSFLHWFRKEMEVLYDIWGPDTPIQAMEQVQSRISSMNVTRLREMVEKQEAFKSEDGKTQYLQLWLKLQLEPGIFQSLYDNDIIYRQSVVSLDKWLEQYEQTTFMNPLTKLGFRTNKIQQLLSGTNVYKEGRADIENGKYMSDNKLGGAFSEMVLAFYNLGDFSELQQILGHNSSFFTREGWIKAMEDISAIQGLRSGGGIKLAPEERKEFEKAFKNGSNTLTDPEAFIKFINRLGTSNLPGSHMELIVTRAIQNSVVKRFFGGKKPAGLDLVTAQAWFFNRFMGGLARNDVSMTEYTDKKGKKYYTPNPSVHDKLSELLNMGANREKYAAKGGGKPYGNLQTLGQFKAAAIDPMIGIVTMEEVPVYDVLGRRVGSEMKHKSLYQVFREAHNLRVRQQQRIDDLRRQYRVDSLPEGAEKDRIEAEIQKEEVELNKLYQLYVAENASFRENAHREYVQVHLKAGKQWMDRIVNGKGLDFNNFTGYDAWGGVTIKRDVLIKDLQKEMLGLARDMVKKYNWMDFNADVKVPFYDRETGKYGFRLGKLGERMFGYDMLNRKEFWLLDDKGKPVKRNGKHVIDYAKVDKDRVTLMKQMFMTEIAADMYNHQKLNSGDLRFRHAYYLNMIEVLKTMPGQVIIDEFKAHGIDVPEGLFNPDDFKWLESRALNGNVLGINMGKFGFNLKWWLSSLRDKTDKDGMGFGKAMSIIGKAIFSGL